MSLSRLFLTFIFLISGALPAHAMNEKERDQLLALTEWFPYMSCQDDKLFKQCYVISTSECEGMSAQSIKGCFLMNKEKWMKPSGGSLEYWKDMLTKCTASDIRAKLKGREIASRFCENRGVKK